MPPAIDPFALLLAPPADPLALLVARPLPPSGESCRVARRLLGHSGEDASAHRPVVVE